MVAAKIVATGRVQRAGDQPGDEIELDRVAGAALKAEAVQEAGARVKAQDLVGVAVDQDVLPGDQHLVEHEDRVVLVEARGQRIVVGGAEPGRDFLVGIAADQLHPRRIHRQDEHDRHVGVGGRGRRVLAEEIVMGDRRRGRHHLGPGHHNAGIGLLLDRDVDVLDFAGRPAAIDRRVDDRVVHEQDRFLRPLVPGARIAGEHALRGVQPLDRDLVRHQIGRAG